MDDFEPPIYGHDLGHITSRPPSRYPTGRRCTVCHIPLSAYNPNERCWTHTPVRYRRIRGRSRK